MDNGSELEREKGLIQKEEDQVLRGQCKETEVAQQKHKVSDREWGEIPGQPSHKGP
jgi:hypothetical protein